MSVKANYNHIGIVFLGLISINGWSQQIILDKPLKAGILTLFPEVNNENTYYYLVDKIHLATDDQGKPQFSFLKYANNLGSSAGTAASTDLEGGGIFHALVTLSVSDEDLQNARRELERLKGGAKIEGPILYKSGKFGLVSSFKDADGGLTSKIVGIGNAPILDGQKAAISIQLTKLGAELLWETFKSPTPDISFTFEMDITGFRSPKRAIIEADFDQIYEHQSFGIGIASTFVAGEISATFDDLTRKGAIKVTQIGDDAKMDELITTAYNKLTEMMFSPLNGSGTPNLSNLSSMGSGQSLLDRASTMLAKNRQEARLVNKEADGRSTRPATPIGSAATGSNGSSSAGSSGSSSETGYQPGTVARQAGIKPPTANPVPDENQERAIVPQLAVLASYEFKKVRQRGIFRIDLNKYTVDNVMMRFDENIGDLSKYIDNSNYFREVNLDNPLYTQREIVATVDVGSIQDFAQYINFVNVRITKRHENGESTTDEVRIDRDNFNKEGNNFRMMYGWKGDSDRRKWREFEYEIDWSIMGGNTISEPLKKTMSNAIGLNPPYQMRYVEFQADPDVVIEKGIRAINIKVYYQVEGKEYIKQVDLNPARGLLSARIDYLSRFNELGYQYEVTWRLKGNQVITTPRKTATETILFVDELQ
ncbi:MAG: hypothetical protein IPL46_14740 [Saprospiraceae bacterium]|nr:hypothetical protein [Saprospiraceae bacterium]